MSRSLINSKSATLSPATGCDLDILSGGGTSCRNLSRRFVMNECITLRTRSGIIKQVVQIVSKVVVGKKMTHNRDGTFVYATAIGCNSEKYETFVGGWRVAKGAK
jgi:hypothetical protein